MHPRFVTRIANTIASKLAKCFDDFIDAPVSPRVRWKATHRAARLMRRMTTAEVRTEVRLDRDTGAMTIDVTMRPAVAIDALNFNLPNGKLEEGGD